MSQHPRPEGPRLTEAALAEHIRFCEGAPPEYKGYAEMAAALRELAQARADLAAAREALETADKRITTLECEKTHRNLIRGYGPDAQQCCSCGWSGTRGIHAQHSNEEWSAHLDSVVRAALAGTVAAGTAEEEDDEDSH